MKVLKVQFEALHYCKMILKSFKKSKLLLIYGVIKDKKHKYRKSYERECITWFMGTSDVFKVLKIARVVRRRVQFENFKNITSGHKSRNARASSYDFLFIIYLTKLLRYATFKLSGSYSDPSFVRISV